MIILLVDERPEEVTDFRTTLAKTGAEVVASSNDNPYARHIEVTEQTLDRAKRMAEQKKRRAHPLRLPHADDARLQQSAHLARAHHVGRHRQPGLPDAAGLLRRRPGASRRAGRSPSSAPPWWTPARGWTRSSTRSSRAPATWSSTSSASWPTGGSIPPSTCMRSGTRREELLFSADDLKKIHLLRRALSGRKPGRGHGDAARPPQADPQQRRLPEEPRRLSPSGAARRPPGRGSARASSRTPI